MTVILKFLKNLEYFLLIRNFLFFSLSFQIVSFKKAEKNIHSRPSHNPIDENYNYLLLLYYYII